jgi:short-subunit dehydrogenase
MPDADQKNVALVTGASSGIGQATAVAFARRGYAVGLFARRKQRLDEVAQRVSAAGGEPLVLTGDVAKRGQVEGAVAQTLARFGRLDVMVNNAGYGVFAAVTELDEKDLRGIFDVNFFGLWYGTVAAASVMTRQGHGHIFNVSSIIGKRASPMHGAYCATKFAVSGLTESARVELRPLGVHVTLVCPAMTESEFFSRGSMARRAGRAFSRFSRPMPAQRVGEAIARAAGRRKPELVFTFGGRLLSLIATISPRAADSMMEIYRRQLVHLK